jgi:hypothetical protein
VPRIVASVMTMSRNIASFTEENNFINDFMNIHPLIFLDEIITPTMSKSKD